MRQVDWEAHDAPAQTQDGASLSQDGIFEATLETGTVAGAEREVVAKYGDLVLGTSDPVVVEPGLASESQSSFVPEKAAIPADGASTVLLTLEAKDQYGNPVADGTVVVWEAAETTDGGFVEAQDFTQDGVATVKYRAGVSVGQKTIRAHVDDAVMELEVEQALIGLGISAPTLKYSYDHTPVEVTLQVTCSAGPVSPEAEIGWFATIGRMEQIQPITDGLAKARWLSGQVSIRPRVHFVATLGEARMQHTMVWERVGYADATLGLGDVRRADGSIAGVYPGGAVLQGAPTSYREASIEPLALAGDLTQDGYVPIENADGTVDSVFVKASGTYRVTGLVPGEHVSVRLGTNRAPNLLPLLHYTGTELDDGVVPDAAGDHDATATTGITLVEPGYRGQAFAFDGMGVMTVPHAPDLELSGGFMVPTAVRPPPDGGPQVLIEKVGDYRLELVDVSGELRARFTVQTVEGEALMTSLVPLYPDDWTVVTGKFESGRLWVALDTDVSQSADFTFLSNPPLHNAAEIQIGPAFVGELDEVRLFDLTQQPLSTFPGGGTSLSFVADDTGTYETTIQSTGQFGLGRVAHYYDTLARESLRLAQDAPPTALQAGLGSELVEIETWYEDTAEHDGGVGRPAPHGRPVPDLRSRHGGRAGYRPREPPLAAAAGTGQQARPAEGRRGDRRPGQGPDHPQVPQQRLRRRGDQGESRRRLLADHVAGAHGYPSRQTSLGVGLEGS